MVVTDTQQRPKTLLNVTGKKLSGSGEVKNDNSRIFIIIYLRSE